MSLTEIERNVVLVALDHMEEHLDTIEDDHLMDPQLYLSRVKAVKSARSKIKRQGEKS